MSPVEAGGRKMRNYEFLETYLKSYASVCPGVVHPLISSFLAHEKVFEIFHGAIANNYNSYSAAEKRADAVDTIVRRNYEGYVCCQQIMKLNQIVKQYTGHPFLSRFYAIDQIGFRSWDIKEMLDMIDEFDGILFRIQNVMKLAS